MSTILFDEHFMYREVVFCKVYGIESKEQIEKLFLKNGISYFIEWQKKSFFKKIVSKLNSKEKNVFTIRINEADVERAKELVQGIEAVKLRKAENSE